MIRMKENREKNKVESSEIMSWVKEIVIAIIIAWLITTFLFSHIMIPTPSMDPTIVPKDHLMINKIPMYYRDPARTEIVVFHGEDKELIKRVVGIPGDILEIKDGSVYINGEKLKEDYLVEGVRTEVPRNSDIEYPFEIPDGRYFVMGDNRGNSKDSRYIGTVLRKDIYAIAGLRIWPLKSFGFLK